MQDFPDTAAEKDTRRTLTGIRRKRRFTAFILLLERLSAAFWRGFFWICGFAGLWLLGMEDYLPREAIIALSLAFYAGLAFFIVSGLRRLRLPRPEEIDRRLEAASGAAHRPLQQIGDRPVNDSGLEARQLWLQARTRVLASVRALRLPAPRAFLAKADPKAFRLLALLLLLSGIAVAGAEWQERLKSGLLPVHSILPQGLPKTITFTLTPPAYTGQGQTILSGPGWAREVQDIPIGSTLKASVRASFGTPSLFIGDMSHKFQKQGEGNFTLEATITQGEAIGVSRFGLPVMHVPVRVVPDTPPSIEIARPDTMGRPAPEDPQAYTVLPDNTLRFALSALDDYGVKDLHMEMTLDPMIEDAPLGEPLSEIRALSSPPGKAQRADPVYDFTASPWAGLPAVVTFRVTDHAGQTGTMPPIALTLPERQFRHPVARILVAQRKALIWAPLQQPENIVSALETLLRTPAQYQNDMVAFLGIKVAAARLKYAWALKEQNLDNSRSVVNLLWDTALRIEDGNLSLAARNLRDAQRELEKALREGAMSKEQMMQLTDKVQQLLGQYLSELQEELQKRMAEGDPLPMVPPEMLSRTLDPEKLQGFMQQMLEEMQNGNPEKAQEMLSQLQRMLDSMNPSLVMPMPKDMRQMEQGVSEMQQLIERQEELLAQTKLQAESLAAPRKALERLKEILQMNEGFSGVIRIPGMEADTPAVNTQANKTEQEALRYILGQLMMTAGEIFKDIPRNLGLAEMEMRESSGRLGENRPDRSIPHQEAAVRHLKEAQDQMRKELGDRLRQMMAGSGAPLFFSMPSFGSRQIDPLGRPFSDGQNGDPNSLYAPVEIPDEAERRRAQEIQKILRDRSGELYRPQEELEYFRRLLKQF